MFPGLVHYLKRSILLKSWIEKYERRIWGDLLSKSEHEVLRKGLFSESLNTALLLKRQMSLPAWKQTPFPSVHLCCTWSSVLSYSLTPCVQRICPQASFSSACKSCGSQPQGMKPGLKLSCGLGTFFFVISHGWELAGAGSLSSETSDSQALFSELRRHLLIMLVYKIVLILNSFRHKENYREGARRERERQLSYWLSETEC